MANTWTDVPAHAGYVLASICFPAVSLFGLAVPTSSVAFPIWAKGAISLPIGCEDSSATQIIRSPDRMTTVEVRCGGSSPDTDGVVLRITTPSGRRKDVKVERPGDEAWRPQELLWASDSSALLINGSDSAYAGDAFIVYQLRADGVVAFELTGAAQRDMARSFPPCKARNLDDRSCKQIEKDPDFNMSALAWTRGAGRVIVMAEIPCSSSYGGIMCQVMGYELEVPTGRILQRMAPRDLKRRFQSKMAWKMSIPDPPFYKSPARRR